MKNFLKWIIFGPVLILMLVFMFLANGFEWIWEKSGL